MGKVRRGNFIFVSWVGDHGHHVHVYRDRRLVLKWDFDLKASIQGEATRRILRLIEELGKEGKL